MVGTVVIVDGVGAQFDPPKKRPFFMRARIKGKYVTDGGDSYSREPIGVTICGVLWGWKNAWEVVIVGRRETSDVTHFSASSDNGTFQSSAVILPLHIYICVIRESKQMIRFRYASSIVFSTKVRRCCIE